MNYYYFNTNTDQNGYHEVHQRGCSYMPSDANRKYIGQFDNCVDAIREANRSYPSLKFDGCYYCCHECHKG